MMRKFIIKTLLLLLPVLILAVSIEYLLVSIPNDYAVKKSYLDQHSEEIEVLILGSSHTYSGINPYYFSNNAFNLAQVSQTLDLDLELLLKYENELHNLNIIILPISSFSLWEKLENEIDSWLLKNYKLYYELGTSKLKDHSELFSVKLTRNLSRLYSYYIKKESTIFCSELGWRTTNKSEFSKDLYATAIEASNRHTKTNIHSDKYKELFYENMNILNQFYSFCMERNIELILITTPTHLHYRNQLNEIQLNTMIETMNDFVKNHPHTHYLNWLNHPDFKDSDYFDADHMNEIGAKKLSLKLSNYIDSLNISQP